MPKNYPNNLKNTNNKKRNKNDAEIAKFKLLYKECPIVQVETLHEDDDSGLYRVVFEKKQSQ